MGKQYAPKNPSRRDGGKKINIIAIELVACFVLTAVLIGTVIGKYRQQFNSYGSARALDFYFTSDFLDGRNHSIAPGTTEFSFTLSNHADDLRFSEMDITYTVEVKKDGGTEATGVKIAINNVDNKTGKMDKDGKRDDTVKISSLTSGKYTITAKATGGADPTNGSAGYLKTLTATIDIPAEGAKLFQHTDSYPDYIQLTIWNEGDQKGTVSISYTGIPDNTNPNMTDWVSSNGTAVMKDNIEIEPYSSKVFRFFGNDAKVESVTNGDSAVENKIPK